MKRTKLPDPPSKPVKQKLTQTELKRQLFYNPDTGLFIWKVSNSNRVKVGDVAGSKKNSYISIRVNGKAYRAHRLAWLYMEGYWPEHDVDHKFGIKNDNRWSELNHTTRSCNLQNTKLYSANKSGFPGVFWVECRKKWRCRIAVNRKLVFLGYYSDLLEAALTRLTFEIQCPLWKCNYRSELAKAIKRAWPQFNIQGAM